MWAEHTIVAQLVPWTLCAREGVHESPCAAVLSATALVIMEPSTFRQTVQWHTRTGQVLSQTELDECYRLGTVISTRLEEKAREMMRERPTKPILCAYLSDG